ncbi:MAG: hypothetical protein BM556_04170 [Bacteriovorax sp. MedPE-SWde]|mgnify:CR=1 FL=1|nr:MAG: hypothetical protein BM556_04170 [Bacteriovorax sp. MedPE-SWde]
MKFWLKIEAFINKLLVSTSDASKSLVSKLTPNKVKDTLTQTKSKSLSLKKNTKEQIENKIKGSKAWTIGKVGQTKQVVASSKEAALTTVSNAKSYDWKSLNFQKITIIVMAVFGPLLFRIKSWYLTLKPTSVLTITITAVAFSLTGITVVQQANEIEDKTAKEVVRKPDSYSDTMDRDKLARSKYRHYKNQRISLAAVSIPVYVESRNGMQSLKIDFTFEADNRYIAKYFTIFENEYLLRDRLNRTIQPIIPTFPMKAEGKNILKAKMKSEINKLIKDLKIKGEIKEIYIHSILNG